MPKQSKKSHRHINGVTSDPIESNQTKNKTKLSPNSKNQFRIGPNFCKTIHVSSVYIEYINQQLTPKIIARVDKGFNLVNDTWCNYRGNQIYVVASFEFEEYDINDTTLIANNKFYTIVDGIRYDVNRFGIRLNVESLNENQNITLSQKATAKEKRQFYEPTIVYSIPGSIPSHVEVKGLSNKQKGDTLKRLTTIDYNQFSIQSNSNSLLSNYENSVPFNTTAVFDRIQFKIKGSKRIKINMPEQENAMLQVQLIAEMEDKKSYAVIAIANTPPLSIKTKTPSSYNLPPIEGSSSKHQVLGRIKNTSSFNNIQQQQLVSSPINVMRNNENKENIDQNLSKVFSLNSKSKLKNYQESVKFDDNGSKPLNEHLSGNQFNQSVKSCFKIIDDYETSSQQIFTPQSLDPLYYLNQINTTIAAPVTTQNPSSSFSENFYKYETDKIVQYVRPSTTTEDFTCEFDSFFDDRNFITPGKIAKDDDH
ncbi:hypothetical protein KGF54_002283 [Candida jiufengensis]|uniref:uncharacterized protein n=1 Tax=Candida jiufengensis TaxID=497108 RepID=UPI00222575C4|nr:uncharacterized protein KGF54_002283 [Candida jiufengensis]KAI5954508.1 hypothetical protein KGF54_002283 [Candida jiufengensis]